MTLPLVHRKLQAETKASPSSIVASVKILALKANLGVQEDINMLASFLECFPNVETLHIEVNDMNSIGSSFVIRKLIISIKMCPLHSSILFYS